MALPPTAPTIHLNGTGYDTLYKEYKSAYKAVKEAINSVCDATMNGRDYYPQGDDAFFQARKEREDALEHLRIVEHYLEGMLVGIMDQNPRHL